jgi:hypothetical protein
VGLVALIVDITVLAGSGLAMRPRQTASGADGFL